MVDWKQEIKQIRRCSETKVKLERGCSGGTKKVCLSANLKLGKPELETEDSIDPKIPVSSQMETVYLGGDSLSEHFDNIGSNVIKPLQFHFSWKWVDADRKEWCLCQSSFLRSNQKIILPSPGSNPAKFELPVKHTAPSGNNCCVYCFVATWHFTFAQTSYDNVGGWKQTPILSRSNLRAHQPLGEFEWRWQSTKFRGSRTWTKYKSMFSGPRRNNSYDSDSLMYLDET